MTPAQYLALLRGINVGGKNIIKMVDLKSCFDSMGFFDVETYIQSGNVLFQTFENDKTVVTSKIERTLYRRFNYRSRIVVITYQQLKKVVEYAPRGFGKYADEYRYDVLFLKEHLVASEVIKNISPKKGVDRAYAGSGVLYFSRLINKASQSRLTKVTTLPEYQHMTIRNWNTTTHLLALMEKRNEL